MLLFVGPVQRNSCHFLLKLQAFIFELSPAGWVGSVIASTFVVPLIKQNFSLLYSCFNSIGKKFRSSNLRPTSKISHNFSVFSSQASERLIGMKKFLVSLRKSASGSHLFLSHLSKDRISHH